jgi:spermidine synthase
MHRPLQLRILYLLVFASGFAGLGYEMVWTRMFAVGLGHEIVAVLAIVAAFFSGMALGAYALDGPVRRSRVPGHWYAGFEAVIGLWSLALIGLIPAVNRLAAPLIGIDTPAAQQWAVAFLLPFLVLLPATAAMGGTLPAVERLFSRLRRDGWSVGGLYGANTLGAVAGTLIATFYLTPRFGFAATLGVLALLNLVCAAGVLWGAARSEASRPEVSIGVGGLPSGRRLLGTLFVTGLLGIGYEVVVVRVVSQVLENTVYTFASVLSVYLLGTALGAALYQRFAPRDRFGDVLARLLQWNAAACVLGVLLLRPSVDLYAIVRGTLGGAMGGSIAGELAVASTVFLPPTLLMGALFSHLAQAARDRHGLGTALGINTLGGALAPPIFAVGLLPLLGSNRTLLLGSLGYLALLPPPTRRRWRLSAIPAAAGLALFLAPSPLWLVTLPPGGELIAHREGVMAAVSVVRDAGGDLHLKINDRFRMGGTASAYSDRRQAHVSLLRHPSPRRALFLGLGTGSTFAAAASHPDLEATGVELIPEILPLLPYFEKSTGDLSDHPQLTIRVADARRFVRSAKRKYDVVIADLFHPSRDGAGYLYTLEHFAAVDAILEEDGLFCQWLPLYQLDLDTLRIITRTFLAVFPEASMHLAHFSLETPIVGLFSRGPERVADPATFSRRLRDPSLGKALAGVRLEDWFALMGTYLGGSAELAAFAAAAPINTDDRPRVLFLAPRFAYSEQPPPHQRLLRLVNRLNPSSGDLSTPFLAPSDGTLSERLQAYWTARNRFLTLGVGVSRRNDPKAMFEQVAKPLLALLHVSPEFDPAYRPLLAVAHALYRVDAPMGRSLLRDLGNVNPGRDEARLLLRKLDSGGG